MLKKILHWADIHLLKYLLIGFIFVIPLLPKLPLQMVNYTYVAVRLDDVYMGIIGLVFAIQYVRRKVQIPSKILWLFLAFWTSVLISFVWGYYVQKTIAIDHLGLLHALRRVEYMMIFLIALTQIKSRKDFKLYLGLLLSSITLVSLYGYGQKYLGWPAVQTMNPEYAKGYILVLDPWSRISSTFAGHYDLSATLTLLLPVILGFALTFKKKFLYFIFALAVGTLVLSATRASYIGYLISTIAYLLYIKKFKVLAFVLLITTIFTPLSDNLTNRISRTFQSTKVSIDTETGDARVTRRLTPDDLPPGDFGAGATVPGQQGVSVSELSPDEALAARLRIQDDVIKQAQKEGREYSEQELSATVDEILSRQVFVTRYLPDISISTRLQVSWPRAIAAFLKNPILGSGPSSLGEATDGDYFRWLGEKGLLGTTLFLVILGTVSLTIFKRARKMSKTNSYVFHAFVFGFAGAFINASTIDIFEASKFAYIFWFTAGLFYAGSKYFPSPKIAVKKLKI